MVSRTDDGLTGVTAASAVRLGSPERLAPRVASRPEGGRQFRFMLPLPLRSDSEV